MSTEVDGRQLLMIVHFLEVAKLPKIPESLEYRKINEELQKLKDFASKFRYVGDGKKTIE